ncbi:MAG: DUF2200 domain-containing protein [Ruminiclostridium sp.]|jgi:hypothetical protein|nr:DUF2200 domain-containing protein [Ruminiclostridium sp.]MCI9466076.1 DUF2200 domain-containing protein [Ruminiclostridium sp.]
MEANKVFAMKLTKLYPRLVDELAKGKPMEKILRQP